MNKININVVGLSNVGKSTLLYLIKKSLKDVGFKIDFDGGIDFGSEDEFDSYFKNNLNERIKKISSDVLITMNETHAYENKK